MVIVFSIEADTSTHEVLDWIAYYGDCFMVVYPTNIARKATQILNLVDNGICPSFWFRKWDNVDGFVEGFSHSLSSESFKLVEYIYYRTKDICYWLNVPRDFNNNNKLIQHDIATKVGFSVPSSFVVDSKDGLESRIKREDRSFITKSFGSQIITEVDGVSRFAYTQLIDQALLSSCANAFFPSLVQEYIEKEYEIRAFYLDGIFFSMAIFSQENEKTRYDYRHYDISRPNRLEPICLPIEIEQSARSFVSQLPANCGSFDFVVSTSGQVFFLEFNQLGQFGMVSKPCNYNIENEIAKLLIAKAKTCSVGCCNSIATSKDNEYVGLSLCMTNLEQVESRGINVCFFSKFYESKYAVMKSLGKPIDLLCR